MADIDPDTSSDQDVLITENEIPYSEGQVTGHNHANEDDHDDRYEELNSPITVDEPTTDPMMAMLEKEIELKWLAIKLEQQGRAYT